MGFRESDLTMERFCDSYFCAIDTEQSSFKLIFNHFLLKGNRINTEWGWEIFDGSFDPWEVVHNGR